MSEQNSTQDGEEKAPHSLSMPFLMVLVFFAMGLVGFLICHILKKKGYRCRTFHDELDLDHKESLTPLDDDDDDEEMNEDTVEKIVKCIIQNEANVEVLKEMLGEGDRELQVPTPVGMPSLCPHRNSQDGGPPHHHTVHLGSTQAPCMHCSKKKRHPLHRQSRSKEGKSKMHPGETTVFSVGRLLRQDGRDPRRALHELEASKTMEKGLPQKTPETSHPSPSDDGPEREEETEPGDGSMTESLPWQPRYEGRARGKERGTGRGLVLPNNENEEVKGFHVTHIGKKPASHDSKEDSLPDSKQDLGSGDLDHEARKGSLNGIVPMDQLQHGRSQEAVGAQSDREPEEACKDESTQGKNLLNTAANLDVPKNGLERKNHPKTGSLQEIDLLGTATSNTCDQKFLCPAELFVSEDLDKMERLAKKAPPSENEGVQRAANDISGNERSQVLRGGSSLDISGNEVNRTQNIEQQEQSSTAQDPGVPV